jgi:uncharacterized DUF497 family protein
MFEWDEAKRAANLAKHSVDFATVEAFEWETALTEPDRRRDYGEARFRGLGLVGERLYFIAYVRRGFVTRVISLRKANEKEVEIYTRGRWPD